MKTPSAGCLVLAEIQHRDAKRQQGTWPFYEDRYYNNDKSNTNILNNTNICNNNETSNTIFCKVKTTTATTTIATTTIAIIIIIIIIIIIVKTKTFLFVSTVNVKRYFFFVLTAYNVFMILYDRFVILDNQRNKEIRWVDYPYPKTISRI